MEEMTAYCGLNCIECGAYEATQNDDDEKRSEVATIWSKMFKADIRPEHINCDGCQAKDGRLFSHCEVCEIRTCGMEKKVDNCGHCDEYPCGKLDFVFEAAPDAKQCLNGINAGL